MDNGETLETLGTQATERRKNKQTKKQTNKQTKTPNEQNTKHRKRKRLATQTQQKKNPSGKPRCSLLLEINVV